MKTNKWITNLGSIIDEKPTVFIDSTRGTNRLYIARYDWDECELYQTYITRKDHAGNALQVAYKYIKPINGAEEINVFLNKRTKKRTKVVHSVIWNPDFFDSLQWNDDQYKDWENIFAELGIEM